VVGIAVFVTSWASILIRLCGDTSAIVISFYRLWWASIFLGLISLMRAEGGHKVSFLKLGRRLWLLPVAGLMLALHFVTWIASLQLTTVAQSLVLESTHPVFALFLAPWVLKERITGRALLSVLITLVGVLAIAGVDFRFQPAYLIGDALALSSALFLTFYLFIARSLGHVVGISVYLAIVYGSAAVVLLIPVGFGTLPLTQYPVAVHLYMLLLAAGPTAIGHSLINWATRFIPVYRINLMMLGELVFASIWAFTLFSEFPGVSFFVGAPFVLTGITLAIGEPISPVRQ